MLTAQSLQFLLRWAISSVSMFVCINLFGSFKPGSEGLKNSFWFYAAAGLLFAIVNAIIKPILTVFSLPLIFLTLGLFSLLLNVAMVGLTIWLIKGVEMTFGGAVLSCIVVALINFFVNTLMIGKGWIIK